MGGYCRVTKWDSEPFSTRCHVSNIVVHHSPFQICTFAQKKEARKQTSRKIPNYCFLLKVKLILR